MKKKMILALLVLSVCSGIYAVTNVTKSSNDEFCDICQPNYNSDCVTYIIENTGNAGIYYCGRGVNIYDVAPED